MNEETKTPETLADIIAEMRRFAAFAADRSRITPAPSLAAEQECHAAKLTKYADRIEAAAERERVSATGNDADLREALKAVIEKLLECAPTAEQEWPELVERARAALERKPEENYGNAAAMREAIVNVASFAANAIDYDGPERDVDAYRWLGRIAQTASAALAAPARNCDRFQTEEEAYAAFMGLFDHFKGERHYQYCRWLFAPAEGGAE